MSEITRGIPEEAQGKAKIIDFEAAKGKRLEEKTRHAQWIQERTQKQPFTEGEAANPVSFQFTTEADQPRQKGRRVTTEGEAGENRPPAENTHMVIDFQKAREKRLLNEQTDAGVSPESDTFPPDFKPRPNEAGENVANDYEGTTPDISVEDEEQRALQEIRAKLARFDVSSEKRDGIIEGLADDPKTSVKVAGVLRHITPPGVRRQVAIELEENAAFRKNIWDKLDEKAGSLQEESQDGSLMELLLGLLKDFMTGKNDEDQDAQDAEAVNR